MGLEAQEGSESPVKNGRRRKTHTKSRKGCKNCKLRRVKCDESRPHCQKCVSYGVKCNYGGGGEETDELQLRGEGAFAFSTTPHSMGPGLGPDAPKDSMSPEGEDDRLNQMLGLPLALHETAEVYRLTKQDVETLRMFRTCTVFTIGTAQSVPTYRVEIINLCYESSCLTHTVLAMTLMHERFINATVPGSVGPPTQQETYHFYHGTAIFNHLLSLPIREEDKDALWGCAALIGAMTIASIDASTPEEAWPLKRDTMSDLDWLRMSDGKKEVWRLVDPLRETSVWKDVMNYQHHQDPQPYTYRVPELDMLFPYLTKIYAFNPMIEKPDDEQDPYHTAASILTRLLELDCNHSTIMYFLSFLGHMDPRFRQLLHRKDPKALLLLAWWYGKMCQYNVWWQRRRMRLEGQAICLYLERYHAEQVEIVRLLDYPKVMTGLVSLREGV